MRLVNILSLLIAFVAPVYAHAQAVPYQDANNLSEAVGMMKINVFSAGLFLRECSKRLPNETAEMTSQMKQWQATDAHDIERANFYWEQMAEKEPRIQELRGRTETYLKGQIALLQQADPNNRAHAVAMFCKQYFADLASGIWRQRTPRMYKFLDTAP